MLKNFSCLPAIAGAIMLIAGSAAAFEEPTGFGKATFGMTSAEFEKAYPGTARKTSTGTENKDPQLNLVAYRLENQRLGPLTGCRVELRFAGPHLELFDIQFLCSDKDKASAYLTKQFGDPTNITKSSLTWTGTKTAINFMPKSGAFNFGDIARSRALQFSLMKAMGGLHLGVNTPTPGAAPATPSNQP